jgi:5'-nucleotidase
MKKVISILVILFVVAGVLFYHTCFRTSEFVILSTNDIHASLDNASRLATAVKKSRDTVFTLVVDAGDRWTGNAYVDLAENRLPIIRVMNAIGYTAATIGNHEFDAGEATLCAAIDHADFPVMCANIKVAECLTKKISQQCRIISPEGVYIDIMGVVTSFANGHPDGNESTFEKMIFENALDVAEREGKGSDADFKILLSHMGHDRDFELAERYNGFDLIVSGHTHQVIDTLISNTVIGQTGRKMKLVGATRVKMRGHKVVSVEYENIPLANYDEDEDMHKLIGEIEGNPTLKFVAGKLANDATHLGLCNLQSEIIRQGTSADIGIYHRGGVRTLEGLPKGEVTVKNLFYNEPFFSQVHTIEMTAAELRRLIITKYNDMTNMKESHRIDLFCSVPYDIVVGADGEAIDVKFPTLQEGKVYRVAMGDYIAKKYPGIEAENITSLSLKLLDILEQHFRTCSPVTASNTPKQRIVRR